MTKTARRGVLLAQILPFCLAQGGKGIFHQALSSPRLCTAKWEVLQGGLAYMGVGGALGGPGQVCIALGQAQIWMVQNP